MSAQSSSDVPHREALAVQLQKRPNPGQRSQDHKRPKIAHRPTSPDHFRVAIFCALAVEAQAATNFFDCYWDEDDVLRDRGATDQNAYTLGAIGRHNVVLVHMPGMGKGHAAKAAADCLGSFPQVEVALLVGICGGVPGGDGKRNVMLGDVVISEYVVQSDFGRRLPDGLAVRKTGVDALERPNAKIRSHISKFKSDPTVEATVADLLSQTKGVIGYPELTNDVLFDPTYRHKHHDGTCDKCARCTSRADPACKESIHASCEELGCDLSKLVSRSHSRAEEGHGIPSVHYGTYASADTVMRSGEDRDEIAKNEGIVAFEMEAVGVWQSFPGRAIIIKGVCDYADSHKNKQWQAYAARTAAAYLKVFLTHWSPAPESARKTTESDVLQEEENRRCLSDLLLTNPRDDKIRIEKTKGGLYLGASRWVLEHKDFLQWRESENARLLWIRGDPGKGKTMLMITIINELEQRLKDPDEDFLLAYFLCQGTDQNLNHATAVLRGLLYQLIMQCPQLISHLRKEYDHSGSKLFEEGNGFFALSQILKKVIEDPHCPKAYLIIDALDECSGQQHHLLELINESATLVPKARWISSSRPIPLALQYLPVDGSGTMLILEILENAQQITQAVNAYIDFQMQEFLSISGTDHRRKKIRTALREKANGTFLWVALVIQELRKAPRHRVLRTLEALPMGLTSLYNLMLAQARQQPEEDWDLCQLILSTITLASRPLHIIELATLSGIPADICNDAEDVKGVLELCGAFISVQDDDMVYVIHQSAQDYLKQNDKATTELFPKGQSYIHRRIYTGSLATMTKTLKWNMYGLPHPGASFQPANPGEDPLLHVRYSVHHWIDHLNEGPDEDISSNTGSVYVFLASKLLNWLEALCLIQALPEGITAVSRLADSIKPRDQQGQLLELVLDVLQFVRYFKSGIERTPLQIYAAGPIFSPKKSIVGELYRAEQPRWFRWPRTIPTRWSACEQVFEGHSGGVYSVAFSPDGSRIASASEDNTVKIWDADTGVCRKTLEGHSREVLSAAFSPDGTWIVSYSLDDTVKIWDVDTGACEKTLKGQSAAAFSPDGTRIASSSTNSTIEIWHVGTGACEKIFEDLSRGVNFVAFSPDGTRIALCDKDDSVWILHTDTANCEQIYHHDKGLIFEAAFSPDGKQIAVTCRLGVIRIWLADGRLCKPDFETETGTTSVAFSPDGKRIATASLGEVVQIWNADTAVCERTLKGHISIVSSVAFSPIGTKVVSGACDNTIRIWDVTLEVDEPTEEEEPRYGALAISRNGMWLATAAWGEKNIRICRAETGLDDKILHREDLTTVSYIVFSPDGIWLASTSLNTIHIWSIETGICHGTLQSKTAHITFIAISADSIWLASPSRNFICISKVGTWVCEWRLRVDRSSDYRTAAVDAAFSPDSARLASAHRDETIKIWCIKTGACEQLVKGDIDGLNLMTFSPDGTQLQLGSGTVIALSDASSQAYFPGYGVSKDKRWITWNGSPILWLPAEYQPGHVGISTTSVAISPDWKSGRILILPLDFASIHKLTEGS